MDGHYSLTPQELRDIVFEYLIANSYPETAKALIHDETARRKRLSSAEHNEANKSSEEKDKQVKETSEIGSAHKRKEIQDAVLWGDIPTARRRLVANFPTVLDTTSDDSFSKQAIFAARDKQSNAQSQTIAPQCYGWTYPHQDLLLPANLSVEMQIQDFLETARTIRVPHPGYRLNRWRHKVPNRPYDVSGLSPRQFDATGQEEDTEDSSSAETSHDDLEPPSPLRFTKEARSVAAEGKLIRPPENPPMDPKTTRHHLLLSKTQSLIIAINKLVSPEARRDYLEELADVTGILAYERPEIALKNRRPIRRLEPPGVKGNSGFEEGMYKAGKGMDGRSRYGSPLGRNRLYEGNLTTDARIHDWLGIHRRISLSQSINESILYHTGRSPVPFLNILASQTTVVFEHLRREKLHLPDQDQRKFLKLQPISRQDLVEAEKKRKKQRERAWKAWSLGQLARKEGSGSDVVETRNQKGWVDMMVGWVEGTNASLSPSSSEGQNAPNGVNWGEYDDDAADSDELYDDILEYPESSSTSSDDDETDGGGIGSGSETDDVNIYPFDVATWLDASERRDRKERRKKRREVGKSEKGVRFMGRTMPSAPLGKGASIGPDTRRGMLELTG